MKNKRENIFIEQLQKTRKLLEMQRKYEEGLLKEKDLTEEEKNDLIKLYKDQIATLQIEIEANGREVQQYKKEIMLERKKIKK